MAQVNLTFRAPEIEGATPTIMVEMVLGGKAPSPIIRQVLEAAVGQCCTVTLSTLGIDVNVVYRAAIRTEFYDPWTIGLSLLVQRLRNHEIEKITVTWLDAEHEGREIVLPAICFMKDNPGWPGIGLWPFMHAASLSR